MNKISEIFQAWVAAANPTPEQKEIAELKAAVASLTKVKSQGKGIDLLADLKKEFASMTDAKPNPDWGVQEYQDIITEMKNASK